ncbi:MAG: sulfite exporter TauE/SafE family protein [Bacteroidales bacterium]
MIFHSTFEYSYLLLPIIGFIIGFFGSMIGGGGGFFFIPILTLMFKVPAQAAVATSLAATLPICIVGSLGHYRKGNLDFRTGSIFALAGIIGAVSGTGITSCLSSKQLKTSFGIYSLLIALYMTISTWRKTGDDPTGEKLHNDSKRTRIAKGSFFGLLSGVIAGTFGTSGAAPILAGLLAIRMPIKLVVGTSLMVVLVNTIFAVGAHFLIGKIDLTLVYFLTAGSILGALAGSKLLAQTKIEHMGNSIRYLYALVMLVLGLLMIIK